MIPDSGGLDLEAWCLVPGFRQDWNGLEEMTEVTAGCEEGIGRNSHTFKLQELGGYTGDPIRSRLGRQRAANILAPKPFKSMGTHGNQWKSVNIYEN